MKKHYLSTFIAALVFCFSAQAQIVNCNGFLKGNYVEAGVNWNGAFGSSVTPPAGYHPQTTSAYFNAAACGGTAVTDSALGFVADPDHDGWSAGSPASFGDFILHGIAQEGWSVMVDGNQVNGWNTNALAVDSITGGMTAAIIAYSDTLGVKTVKWQGQLSGLYFTQFASLDTANLYIKVQVLIENTSLTTMNDIYYMRTINPHNDASVSSSLTTRNKIEFQQPDSFNRSIVSSKGITYTGAYLALISQDESAKAFLCKYATLPDATTIDNIFAGDTNYLYGVHDSIDGNLGMGLVYNVGTLNSGGAAVVNFIYAFRADVLDSAIIEPNGITDISGLRYDVFPNPAQQTLHINGLAHNDEVELYNIIGSQMAASHDNNTDTIDVSALPPGMYIAVIKNKAGITTGRVKWQKL